MPTLTSGWMRVVLAGALVSTLAWYFVEQPASPPAPGAAWALQRPAFVNAQEGTTAVQVAAILDQEAGIAAYYHAPSGISLSQVRSQFRTIETDAPTYLLGSVAVPNYAENFDVHVYVDVNGWILAYYLKVDPAAKIADVRAQSTASTKLQTVASIVAGAAGAPFSDVTYYDFRYPNATHLLLVGENPSSGNDFTINVPSSYGYFERSWSILNITCCNWSFKLDGMNQPETYGADSVYYGTIAAPQFLPDTTHTIVVDDYGVLALLYRVP